MINQSSSSSISTLFPSAYTNRVKLNALVTHGHLFSSRLDRIDDENSGSAIGPVEPVGSGSLTASGHDAPSLAVTYAGGGFGGRQNAGFGDFGARGDVAAGIRRPTGSPPGRPEADQGDVVGLDMAARELVDLPKDRLADRFGAASRALDALQEAAVLLGVVQILRRVPRVGHAVGVDDGNIARPVARP